MRGRAHELRGVLNESQIPALLVDNDRRYIEANAAARLILRMPLKELRRNRVDDLTADDELPRLRDFWAQMLVQGLVGGTCLMTFKDDSTLWVFYAALANVLPAQHLIVFVPADWPGDEFETMQPQSHGEPQATLSPRQLDVLRLIAAGRSAGQIATELSISVATVKTHVEHVLARLGAHNRAHAVALAMTPGSSSVAFPGLREDSRSLTTDRHYITRTGT